MRGAAPSSLAREPRPGPVLASSQFQDNYFTEPCSGSEAGSSLMLIDSCITQRARYPCVQVAAFRLLIRFYSSPDHCYTV